MPPLIFPLCIFVHITQLGHGIQCKSTRCCGHLSTGRPTAPPAAPCTRGNGGGRRQLHPRCCLGAAVAAWLKRATGTASHGPCCPAGQAREAQAGALRRTAKSSTSGRHMRCSHCFGRHPPATRAHHSFRGAAATRHVGPQGLPGIPWPQAAGSSGTWRARCRRCRGRGSPAHTRRRSIRDETQTAQGMMGKRNKVKASCETGQSSRARRDLCMSACMLTDALCELVCGLMLLP